MMINTPTFSKGLIIFLVYNIEIILRNSSLGMGHDVIPVELEIQIEETLFDLLKKENKDNQFAINLKKINENKKTVTQQPSEKLICAIQRGILNELTNNTYPTFRINSFFDDIHIVLPIKLPKLDNEPISISVYLYAPYIFDYLRTKFSIDKHKYISSICDKPLVGLPNPGASASQLYFTEDNKFIIKTLQHNECDNLLNLISNYHQHFTNYPESLLPKFSGYYGASGLLSTLKVVTMNNLLPSEIQIDEKFDLKGSTHGRKASGTKNSKSLPTFKDLDFNEKYPSGICLEPVFYTNLIETLRNDCTLLASLNIMDYSLLMGIYKFQTSTGEYKNDEFKKAAEIKFQNATNTEKQLIHITDDSEKKYQHLFKNAIPASYEGKQLLLFVGIIDVLQAFHIKKKVELGMKQLSLLFSPSSKEDGKSISVQRADFYCERFVTYMKESVFRTDSLPSKTVNASQDEKSVNNCISSTKVVINTY